MVFHLRCRVDRRRAICHGPVPAHHARFQYPEIRADQFVYRFRHFRIFDERRTSGAAFKSGPLSQKVIVAAGGVGRLDGNHNCFRNPPGAKLDGQL